MRQDIERAAIFLSANQPISDDTLEMLYGCVAWCLDRRHDEDSEVYRNRARAILSAANQPKVMT